MKICVQLPINSPSMLPQTRPYFDSLKAHFSQVKRPDTEIMIRDVATGYCTPDEKDLFNYSGTRLFNDVEILRSVLAAEKEGCDAVSISCFFDPVLYEARQLLKIPVTGLAESSMHLASIMGTRFAVITLIPSFIPRIEENIRRYGMETKVISHNPVRCLTLEPEKMQKIDEASLSGGQIDYTPLIENFTKLARCCIEDGAEVIIIGCGGLSPLVHKTGIKQVDGAAVIEPMLVSLKYAEMLVDLKKAGIPFISRNLSHKEVPDELIRSVLKRGT